MAIPSQALKKEGVVLLVVPDYEDRWIFDTHHLFVPTEKQLINLLKKTGFEILDCRLRSGDSMSFLVCEAKKLGDWKCMERA